MAGQYEARFAQALKRAVEKSGAPGAVACVGNREEIFFHGAAGYAQLTPEKRPATVETPYDLASLTKVVATTSAAMLLWEEGRLDLDRPVADYAPLPGFQRFTPRQLMTHTTGLPPFKLWYKEVSSLNEVLQRIANEPLSWTPGARRRYSDLGFMTLGKLVELCARESLDAFCQRRIFAPLGMNATGFRPPRAWRDHCAATEVCPWRKQVMIGQVHDESAFAVGGVSGHAGLFSTASDLARFCRALLSGKLLRTETLETMTTLGLTPPYPWQGLGWKVSPWMYGSEGYLPSRKAFGHTGWTGTAIWMDRDLGHFAILLSNTCHPDRGHRNNRTLRRTFFTPVAESLYPQQGNVHTGLDRLVRDDFDHLMGKRLALLTNHAAVDEIGRPILDVFGLQPEIRIQRIYSPEHGFHGQAEAGAKVDAQAHARVPLTSLYGKRQRPSADELKEIDLFVVDLPDIGARYYTYMATMKECMAACAEAGVSVLVLDRPNPVGGVALEGPMPTQTGSLVCCAPIPVRHGMTLGELALFFQQQFFRKQRLKVEVVSCDNWTREKLFRDTGLPWIPPSPNIPTPETALLYIGACLFEGVNLNEGRGTETPFELLGAPWLDAEAVLARLHSGAFIGLHAETTTYTPRPIPGKAANPEYKDKPCKGLRLVLDDPQAARPFLAAVEILRAIQAQHGDRLQWKAAFDTLAGGPWLRQQIQQDAPAETISAAMAAQLRAFRKQMPQRYVTRADLLAELA